MLPKGYSLLYAGFSKMSSTFSKNIKKIFYGAQFLRNLLIKTGSFQPKILFKNSIWENSSYAKRVRIL